MSGLAKAILGGSEAPREDEDDSGDLDVGLITLAEELIDAVRDGKATEVARNLKAFCEMVEDQAANGQEG